MARTTMLAFRRAGSTTWTVIGSGATTHPLEEIAMTAATLHVVPEAMPAGDNVTKMGWLLKKQRQAREAADWAYSLPRRLWDWGWEFFNMDAVVSNLAMAGSWIKEQALGFGRFVGTAGGIGLGLLAVTTDAGRSVLKNTVGRVLGWIGKGCSFLWNGTRKVFSSLGSPGRWVSARMWNIEKGVKSAAVNVLGFYTDNIAPRLDVDGRTMRTGRAVGVWALAIRALQYITPLPLQIGIIAAVSMWTLVESPLAEVPGFEKAATWLRGDEPKPAEVKAVDAQYSAAVEAAAIATATTGKVAPPQGGRQAQRAAARKHRAGADSS